MACLFGRFRFVSSLLIFFFFSSPSSEEKKEGEENWKWKKMVFFVRKGEYVKRCGLRRGDI